MASLFLNYAVLSMASADFPTNRAGNFIGRTGILFVRTGKLLRLNRGRVRVVHKPRRGKMTRPTEACEGIRGGCRGSEVNYQVKTTRRCGACSFDTALPPCRAKKQTTIGRLFGGLAGIEYRLSIGDYVSGEELAVAIENDTDKILPDQVRDYLCRFLRGKVKKKPGPNRVTTHPSAAV
jgi:hypothetical protein